MNTIKLIEPAPEAATKASTTENIAIAATYETMLG
jgi:hypothetical protein